MPNYSKAKIYKITSNDAKDVYIGSTCQSLKDRLCKHKYSFKKGKTCPTSKEILKYADCKIELIEEFPCATKRELLEREGYHIRITPNCVNRNVMGRTKAQYYVDNKEVIAVKSKKYAQKNATKIAEYQKKYAEEHKEHLKEYHKNYHEKNREKYNAMGKENYRAKRQEYIERAKKSYLKNKAKLVEPVVCECGITVQKRRLREHKKTKTHLAIICK